MVIDKNHPALQGNPGDFIKDEISNSKILIYEIDKAILYLTANRYSRYTIDTGQDQMTVWHQDLPALMERRSALIDQISALEFRESNPPSAFVARPV